MSGPANDDLIGILRSAIQREIRGPKVPEFVVMPKERYEEFKVMVIKARAEREMRTEVDIEREMVGQVLMFQGVRVYSSADGVCL